MLNEIPLSRVTIPHILSWTSGILTTQQLATLPHFGIIIGLSALGLLIWKRLRLIGCFLLGLSWAMGWAALTLQSSLPAELEGRDIWVEGHVLDLPRVRDGTLRFDFRVEHSAVPGSMPRTLRINWFNPDTTLKAGERWHLTVRVKRPHGYFNPGGLDYEQWLFAQGIGATGYVRADPANQRLGFADMRHIAQAWRQWLADRLDQALQWSDLRSIIKALTMGVEDDITPAQWDVLRRTGTAHLVAISGSHIGLVAGWCFLLTRRVTILLGPIRPCPTDIAALVAFGAALFYSALADFAIPTQRALIMIALVMGAVLLRRPLRPWHTLSLALLAVTAYDPMAVVAPGFWLSFGAVTLIALALGGRLGPPSFWRGLLRINGVTALGLTPLLLLFFQQVSLISPLANLLAVPLLGLLAIPLCLIGAFLLSVYPPLGDWILSLTEHALQPVWCALEWLSVLPLSQWTHAGPPSWTLLFALPGVALLTLPHGIPARWLGAVLLLPSLTYVPERPAPGGMRLSLLDVGQGLATVVETAAHILVFDTGARFGSDFDLGGAVIEPYLRQRGVERIDTLVVSHGDNDHIGGAATLLRHFPVAMAYSSVPEQLPQARPSPCHAGVRWEWDGVSFDMLAPLFPMNKENDNSCVLRVATRNGSVLLSGDIETAAELAMVAHYGRALASTVLVAPHHGSKTSSGIPFLEQVRPRDILIPAGYRNRYGFPHPDVLQRYRAMGARIFNTAHSGAITVLFPPDSDAREPESYRDQRGRYWNMRPVR